MTKIRCISVAVARLLQHRASDYLMGAFYAAGRRGSGHGHLAGHQCVVPALSLLREERQGGHCAFAGRISVRTAVMAHPAHRRANLAAGWFPSRWRSSSRSSRTCAADTDARRRSASWRRSSAYLSRAVVDALDGLGALGAAEHRCAGKVGCAQWQTLSHALATGELLGIVVPSSRSTRRTALSGRSPHDAAVIVAAARTAGYIFDRISRYSLRFSEDCARGRSKLSLHNVVPS